MKSAKPKNTGPMDRPNVLWGFVDSDWADSLRSISGYALMLNDAAISWKSKRQSVVALRLSTAEAEFSAASFMVQEVIYACRQLERLGFPLSDPTLIYEDNSTCIKWAGGAVGGSDRASILISASVQVLSMKLSQENLKRVPGRSSWSR